MGELPLFFVTGKHHALGDMKVWRHTFLDPPWALASAGFASGNEVPVPAG
jgi:hypothetical protein